MIDKSMREVTRKQSSQKLPNAYPFFTYSSFYLVFSSPSSFYPFIPLQCRPRRFGILGQLGFQGIEAVELLLVAETGHEFHP